MNSGLGSISKIPTGLRTLIDAQKALRQEAAPVTPQGTPTVAGQMEQAINQRMQQQAPQQMPQDMSQGQPGMMPNDPFHEQLMKTLQAQAQAQMQSQQPQQQPQPQQAGIAQLPAPNMQNMREGGVVGYFGGGDLDEEYDADEDYGEAAPADQGGAGAVAYEPAQDIEREKALLLKRAPAVGIQAAKPELTPAQQILEMVKETRGRLRQAEEMKPPEAYTREQAYKDVEAAVPSKPWEEKRKGIEQLVKKQEAILNRGQQLYEQEKANRRDDLIQAFLGSKGAGAGGRAVAEMQNAHQARDQQFTNQLIKDFEYTKSLFDLSNSANQDEYKYNLDKTLGKVSDYEKAVDLFKNDRSVLSAALRGQLTSEMNAWGKAFAAEQRAGKMTDTENYAQGYLESQRAKGDDRPEEVILQEGRTNRLNAIQAAAQARVGVAGRAIDQNILNEASKAASKAIADAEAKPGSALARELREARKDPNARARIKDRLYREELRNRGVDPNQVPGPAPEITTAAPTAAPTTSTGAKRYKLDELPNQPK